MGGESGGLSRRQFMRGVGATGLALLAACGRLPGQAAPAKQPRIGILTPGPGPPVEVLTALQEGLRERGYVEGQTLVVERRMSADDFTDLDALAAELVSLRVDLILAFTTLGALAAKRATDSIPIVFTGVSDPVGSGLAANLGRPGGNVTGVSDFGAAISGKRLELLRDAVPGTTRIGVVWGTGNLANELQWRELQAVAPALGVQLISLDIHAQDAQQDAFETAAHEQVQALVVLGSPEIAQRAARLTATYRFPALFEQPSAARSDGLMAYGPNRPDLWRRSAYYVDRILKGAKPADLPIEQPTTFELIVNLRTAQALGLTIPQHVLLQATEIVQ